MLSIKTGWEVHNDIQLISRKETNIFTQCYSNLTEKKDKKGALVKGVSYCFSPLNMERSMAEHSLGRGVLLIPMSSSDGKRK